MPIDRLILCGRGSFWKSSFRLRIGSPANGGMCSNMVVVWGVSCSSAGSVRSASQCRGDVLVDGLGLVGRRVALQHLTVLADQELREVPLDYLAAEDAGLLALQPFPQRMCVAAVDLDLA